MVSVVGAQLYNFQLLSLQTTVEGVEIGLSALELLVPIVGNVVYVIGFIVGAKKQW